MPGVGNLQLFGSPMMRGGRMMNAGMRAAFHQSAAQPFQGSHSRDAIPDIVYHRHKSQQSQVAAAPRLDLGGLRPALTMMSHGQTSHQEEAVPDPAQQALVPHRNARQDIPAGLQRFAPGAPRFSGEKTYETAGGKSADGAGQATTMPKSVFIPSQPDLGVRSRSQTPQATENS